MKRQELHVKRVYDPADAADGKRVLVDRLWPRGVARERAKIDLWLKDIAPSAGLRRRFHGNPAAWAEFRTAYFAELEHVAPPAAVRELLDLVKGGTATLLYAARDETHNNAVALKEWLDLRRGG